MSLALAWSSVRAGAMTAVSGGMGTKELQNGITDFSGRTYDSLSIPSGETAGGWVEHQAAGGYREEAAGGTLYNAVTDFTGRSYDSLEIGPVSAAGGWMESASPGGYREEGMIRKLYNGVTDFSGRTYDSL